MNNRQFLLHASWTFHHDMDEQGVNEQELWKPLNANPRMLDTQVNLTEDFLSERCCAFLRFAKFCGNLGLKSSRKTSNCVAGFVKQVVPLSLQNGVSYCRGWLADRLASGRFYRCFALRKRCLGDRTTSKPSVRWIKEQNISNSGWPRMKPTGWKRKRHPIRPWAVTSE